MNVIKKLIELREKSGLSDYRIAKEAGLSPSTVSNIFTRNTVPRVDTLESVCGVFGVTLAQFFQENEEMALLSEEEIEMLSKWKTLSEKKKKAVRSLLSAMIEDE